MGDAVKDDVGDFVGDATPSKKFSEAPSEYGIRNNSIDTITRSRSSSNRGHRPHIFLPQTFSLNVTCRAMKGGKRKIKNRDASTKTDLASPFVNQLSRYETRKKGL